jgi:uncharacterized protein YaiI (UPF0178 family)
MADEVTEEIMQRTGADEEVVQAAINLSNKLEKTGITGIRYMGRSREKMKRVGPMLAKRNITRELRKRFRG